MTGPISHVSDTARWVAIYRAMESERTDAIFRDPFARRLGGEQGEAIVRHMKRGRAMAWAMIVRTAVMDELIARCVARGCRTVLNLAAGLDTRPFRLDLPRELTWFHVDLPPMVEYVRGALEGETPRCRLEWAAADLTAAPARDAVLARAAAAAAGSHLLVITEGLLIYLKRDQVRDLAREVHDVALARWWITDLASPLLEQFMRRQWSRQLAAGNAPMQFFPPEGTGFFGPLGWREAEWRSMWDESWRLKRTMPMARLWKVLSLLQSRERHEAGRRMSGVALLERTG